MSARVAVRRIIATDEYVYVDVPQGNHAVVTDEGYLKLYTQEGWGKTHAGLFKKWDHVVIDQRWLRGPDGKFVSKEKR